MKTATNPKSRSAPLKALPVSKLESALTAAEDLLIQAREQLDKAQNILFFKAQERDRRTVELIAQHVSTCRRTVALLQGSIAEGRR